MGHVTVAFLFGASDKMFDFSQASRVMLVIGALITMRDASEIWALMMIFRTEVMVLERFEAGVDLVRFLQTSAFCKTRLALVVFRTVLAHNFMLSAMGANLRNVHTGFPDALPFPGTVLADCWIVEVEVIASKSFVRAMVVRAVVHAANLFVDLRTVARIFFRAVKQALE